MLAFATYITDSDIYSSNGMPWQNALNPSDAVTAQCADEPSVAAGYNMILDAFAAEPAIDVLVISRQELTVDDVRLVEKLRAVFGDPSVAEAGLCGARGINNMSWWDAEICGSLRDLPGAAATTFETQEVDVIDNSFIAISKWAMQSLRFDEKIGTSFYGIVEDFCMQARSMDKRVVVTDISASTIDPTRISNMEMYRWAHSAFAMKWTAQLHTPERGHLYPLLEIGGGTNAMHGWLSIDTEHAEGEFLRGAQETPWPIPDEHIRLIWASHVMEHIPAGSERIAVMNEAWRVLRPGGLFEIRLPCFPHWSAVADPTHVSFWVPESFMYFTGQLGANADYGFQLWEAASLEVNDGWELRGVLRKPVL